MYVTTVNLDKEQSSAASYIIKHEAKQP